jgi:hypothetical protein
MGLERPLIQFLGRSAAEAKRIRPIPVRATGPFLEEDVDPEEQVDERDEREDGVPTHHFEVVQTLDGLEKRDHHGGDGQKEGESADEPGELIAPGLRQPNEQRRDDANDEAPEEVAAAVQPAVPGKDFLR